MQSGITVSAELATAFNDLVSTPTLRAVIATITSETLTAAHTVPSTTPSFVDDLDSLPSHLSPTQAAYILLRRYPNAPDGYIAVTYVPDAAPVRQKTLFASTRLTLVRELGAERFREQVFVTELKELTKEGWERHDASGALTAPLTEEEEVLQGVKWAEAEARGGTEGRRLETGGGGKLSIAISGEARAALEGLQDDEGAAGGRLVQLGIDLKSEEIGLVGTSEVGSADGLAGAISDAFPRYSFYRYKYDVAGQEQRPLVFIYTCPSGSKVRERMVYASSKEGLVGAARAEIGLDIAKKVCAHRENSHRYKSGG